MMVMITDQEVRQNRPLRTDDELRRDFAAEPEEIARMLAYHVHGLDLMRASAEWAANPMTSRVDAEMERKIGVLRAILAKGGPDL